MWLVIIPLAVLCCTQFISLLQYRKEMQFKDMAYKELIGRVETLCLLNAKSRTVTGNIHPDFPAHTVLMIEHNGQNQYLALSQYALDRAIELGNANKKGIEYLLNVNGISTS